MIEGIDLNTVAWIGWLIAAPLLFMVVFSADMIKLKLGSTMARKKGAKIIVDITKDKNIRFKVMTLGKDGKLHKDKNSVEWNHTRQFFAPQFGCQAAFLLQGTKSIFDPIGDKQVDLADGEVVDRMVKRAELMRDINAGWMDTKEQKMLVLILIVCVIGAGLTFATQAQVGEAMEFLKPAIKALASSVESIPRTL